VILNDWFINIFESSDIINFGKLNDLLGYYPCQFEGTLLKKCKNNIRNSCDVQSNNRTSNVDNIWQDGFFFKKL